MRRATNDASLDNSIYFLFLMLQIKDYRKTESIAHRRRWLLPQTLTDYLLQYTENVLPLC